MQKFSRKGMRFFLDANVRKSVGRYLEAQGHEVRYCAGTKEHDSTDEDLLALAYQEERILITNDKDFGNLIFLQRRAHHGVILFRLTAESAASYQTKMQLLLVTVGVKLQDHFVVVTDFHIRLR